MNFFKLLSSFLLTGVTSLLRPFLPTATPFILHSPLHVHSHRIGPGRRSNGIQGGSASHAGKPEAYYRKKT